MEPEQTWGATPSPIKAIQDFADTETLRANEAEAKMLAAHRKLDDIRWVASYIIDAKLWFNNTLLHKFSAVVLKIVNG